MHDTFMKPDRMQVLDPALLSTSQKVKTWGSLRKYIVAGLMPGTLTQFDKQQHSRRTRNLGVLTYMIVIRIR